MKQFVFDIHDSQSASGDAEGSEMSDQEEARRQALGALRDMAHDELPDGNRHDFAVKVWTGAGRVIHAATRVIHAATLSPSGH